MTDNDIEHGADGAGKHPKDENSAEQQPDSNRRAGEGFRFAGRTAHDLPTLISASRSIPDRLIDLARRTERAA